MIKFKAFFLSVFFGLLTHNSLFGEIDLQRIQDIYLPKNPNKYEKQAAQALRQHFSKMLGRDLKLKHLGGDEALPKENYIAMGRDLAFRSGLFTAKAFDEFEYDEFHVKAQDRKIVIASKEPHATHYAAMRFLERFGFQWYARDCQVRPVITKRILEDFQIREKPGMLLRRGFPIELGGTPDKLIGHAGEAAKKEGLNIKLWYDHSSGYLVPRELYMKSKPEYFAVRLDGSREPWRNNDSYVHLCLSNPDVIRISIERTLKWISLQPERKFFCVTAGDGHGWCQCQNCRKDDVQYGIYSDRLLKFVNTVARAVAKKYPDKTIITFAYSGSEDAALRVKPEKNVWLMYAPYWGIALSESHNLEHPLNREALDQFIRWKKALPDNLMVYDYSLNFCPSWDAMSEKIKFYHENGVNGFFRCGATTCFNRLFMYMVGKMLWDPTLDIQKLKKDFVYAYYEEAAPHMMAHLNVIDEQLAKGYHRGLHSRVKAGYFEKKALMKMMSSLDRAEAAVAKKPKILARIHKERQLLIDEAVISVKLDDEAMTPDWRKYMISFFNTHWLKDQVRIAKSTSKGGPEAKVVLKKQLRKIQARMNHFAGMKITSQASVLNVASAFLKAPEATIEKYPVPMKEKAPVIKLTDGYQIPLKSFEGGRFCKNYNWYVNKRKDCIALYVPNSPRPSSAKSVVDLEKVPTGKARLIIEGMDSDKDVGPAASISIHINGQQVFSGECGLPHRHWGVREFELPANLLKSGKNTIEINNIKMDTQRLDLWWFMFSDIKIVFDS